MSFITWEARFSVDDPELDADHRILFDLVNQFHDAYARNRGVLEMEPVFDVLMDYTARHFAREEAHMDAIGYPWLPEHRASHEALREELEGLHTLYLREGGRAACIDMIAFLHNWLRFHILESDADYARFARAQARNEADSGGA